MGRALPDAPALGYESARGSAQRVEAHRDDAGAGRADGPGRAHGEIELATAHVGTAVGDGHDDVAPVAQIGDAHLGAEAQRAVGRRELALPEDASTGGPPAVEAGPVVRRANGGG